MLGITTLARPMGSVSIWKSSNSISQRLLKSSFNVRLLSYNSVSRSSQLCGSNRLNVQSTMRTVGLLRMASQRPMAVSKISALSTIFSKRTYATHNELRSRVKRERQQEFYQNVKSPLIFTVAFIAGVFLITPVLFNYTPLSYFKNHQKELLYAIIGLNCLVFGAWQLANQGALSNKQVTTLMKYFLHTKNVPGRQNNVSMILSGFSHQDFFHILFNMLCFYSFGSTMVYALGSEKFLEIYLTGIAGSSLASTIFSAFTRAGIVSSLGASGGVATIFAMFGMLFPKASVAFWFIPIPGGASIALLGFTLYNVAGAALKWSTFDFAAHLGGTFVGIAYAQYIKYLIDQRKKQKQQRRYF